MTARPAFVFALVVVAGAAWLAIQTGGGFAPPSRPLAVTPGVDSPFDPIVRSVQSQPGRLQAYLAGVPPLGRPARDPFRFREPAAPVRRMPPALSTASATIAQARPGMTLSGIAEDPSPNGPVRIAIIAAMGQLFVVKEGETFARRFRVLKIGADAAQVADLTDGTAFTLTLK